MDVMKICVTGSSGRAGRAVVAELGERGHEVLGADLVPARDDDRSRPAHFLRADLTDYGQAVEVLSGADAVIHLANIPAPGLRTPSETFNHNMTMNFNVFQAAAQTGIGRVVWASSETTLGLPFDVAPRYAPVDEDHYPSADIDLRPVEGSKTRPGKRPLGAPRRFQPCVRWNYRPRAAIRGGWQLSQVIKTGPRSSVADRDLA
jgi:nucleoside-diphosphate-sugar epimerase